MEKLLINRKALRAALWGMQKDVAEVLGISQSTMYRMIKGDKDITIRAINAICEICKVDASDFVRFSGEKSGSGGFEGRVAA